MFKRIKKSSVKVVHIDEKGLESDLEAIRASPNFEFQKELAEALNVEKVRFYVIKQRRKEPNVVHQWKNLAAEKKVAYIKKQVKYDVRLQTQAKNFTHNLHPLQSCIRLSEYSIVKRIYDKYVRVDMVGTPNRNDVYTDLLLKFYDQKTTFERREDEKENLKSFGDITKTEDSEFRFVDMCNRLIPNEILLIVLDFLPRNSSILYNVGSVNRHFYLAILSTWHQLSITPNTVIRTISLLALRSVREITFQISEDLLMDLPAESVSYIIENLSHRKLRKINFFEGYNQRVKSQFRSSPNNFSEYSYYYSLVTLKKKMEERNEKIATLSVTTLVDNTRMLDTFTPLGQLFPNLRSLKIWCYDISRLTQGVKHLTELSMRLICNWGNDWRSKLSLPEAYPSTDARKSLRSLEITNINLFTHFIPFMKQISTMLNSGFCRLQKLIFRFRDVGIMRPTQPRMQPATPPSFSLHQLLTDFSINCPSLRSVILDMRAKSFDYHYELFSSPIEVIYPTNLKNIEEFQLLTNKNLFSCTSHRWLNIDLRDILRTGFVFDQSNSFKRVVLNVSLFKNVTMLRYDQTSFLTFLSFLRDKKSRGEMLTKREMMREESVKRENLDNLKKNVQVAKNEFFPVLNQIFEMLRVDSARFGKLEYVHFIIPTSGMFFSRGLLDVKISSNRYGKKKMRVCADERIDLDNTYMYRWEKILSTSRTAIPDTLDLDDEDELVELFVKPGLSYYANALNARYSPHCLLEMIMYLLVHRELESILEVGFFDTYELVFRRCLERCPLQRKYLDDVEKKISSLLGKNWVLESKVVEFMEFVKFGKKKISSAVFKISRL